MTENQIDGHYTLARGTLEEARRMIGRTSEVRFGDHPVNWPMIKQYCAMTHDANPSYWDEDFATRHWGGIISPPGMLATWVTPIDWKPGASAPAPVLVTQVPLPGDTMINVSTEMEFLLPMRVGDHINTYDELTDVSDEKETRMGRGHFFTTVAHFRRQDGEAVARSTNVMLRFAAR